VAAQTSFADFPRVTSILARDSFMPRQLSNLGDRLAFDNGIIALGVFSALFIIAKKGSVDLLIPFFTIGVFQAFTLSQFGMVKHWFKVKGHGWRSKAFLNGLGGLATFVVFADIIAEKFWDGAWFIMILIGIMLFIFKYISQHYKQHAEGLALPENSDPLLPIKNHVLVLVQGVHAGTVNSMRYAESICKNCQAVYVEIEPDNTEPMKRSWQKMFPQIELVVLPSPYRSLLHPLLCYIDSIEKEHPDENVTVIIGEYATDKWWHHFLHGNTGLLLKVALLSRPEVVVTNVRYALKSKNA
jgi:hypothetical protein